MLSYQHGFHAGNLADIHKHIILVTLWNKLKSKPRALSYFETHAGRGLYQIDGEMAQKTGEYDEGMKLYQGGAKAFDEALIKARTKYGENIYPGSPAFIHSLSAPGDNLVLCEFHPQEYQALKSNMGQDVHIHKADGFERLLALAPLKPRRGLVLIDPSYELKTDYENIPIVVGRAFRKWPQMTMLIWYPLLEDKRHKAMVKKLETQTGFVSEKYFKNSKMRMKGSGMLVLNPPFGFKADVEKELQALAGLFK